MFFFLILRTAFLFQRHFFEPIFRIFYERLFFSFLEKGPIRIMSAVGLYRKRERADVQRITNPLKAYEWVQMFSRRLPQHAQQSAPFSSSFFFKQRIIINWWNLSHLHTSGSLNEIGENMSANLSVAVCVQFSLFFFFRFNSQSLLNITAY